MRTRVPTQAWQLAPAPARTLARPWALMPVPTLALALALAPATAGALKLTLFPWQQAQATRA